MPLRRATMPLWSAFFYLQVPHVRMAIESNLVQLLGLKPPRLQLWAFRTFTNYCHSIANAYLPYIGVDPGLEVELTGGEHLRGNLHPGRGAIVATGHLGSWQLGPHYLDRHGFPPVTVVMTEEPDSDAQRIVAEIRDHRPREAGGLPWSAGRAPQTDPAREAGGLPWSAGQARETDATRGAWTARVVYPGRSPLLGLELRATLRRGELVAFQMDRPSADGGLRVPCLGGQATFAAGPALLARTCDVPVVPVFFPVEGRRLRILVEPPLWARRTGDRQRDVLELTRELSRVYEGMIRRYPDQWFNFYDFWGETCVG